MTRIRPATFRMSVPQGLRAGNIGSWQPKTRCETTVMPAVYDRTAVAARHQRAIGKGAKVLDLDHYLEILYRKPGALPGAKALAPARTSKTFTAEHDRFWAAAARMAHGDAAGTRALVEVLLLHRHLDRADVLADAQAFRRCRLGPESCPRLGAALRRVGAGLRSALSLALSSSSWV
jgi:hypothetical protein